MGSLFSGLTGLVLVAAVEGTRKARGRLAQRGDNREHAIVRYLSEEKEEVHTGASVGPQLSAHRRPGEASARAAGLYSMACQDALARSAGLFRTLAGKLGRTHKRWRWRGQSMLFSINNVTSMWVRNPKAGSEGIWQGLEKLLQHRPQTLVGDDDYGHPNFTWAVVRDPASHTVAGYQEVMLRFAPSTTKRGRPKRNHNGNNSALKALFAMPCDTQAGATDRYATFLEFLLNGTELGSESFHAWPQVMLIRVSSGLHMDALVNLDGDFTDQMRSEILPRILTSDDKLNTVLKRDSNLSAIQYPHSLSSLPCRTNIDMSSRRVVRALCELLEADYVCLRYAQRFNCSSR